VYDVAGVHGAGHRFAVWTGRSRLDPHLAMHGGEAAAADVLFSQASGTRSRVPGSIRYGSAIRFNCCSFGSSDGSDR
jgi:hypothetical protein